MKSSLNFWALCLAMSVALPSAAAPKTDLTKVGGIIKRIDNLVQSTLQSKQARHKTPEVATSYVPGQGLTIMVKAIAPELLHSLQQGEGTQPQSDEQKAQTQLVATKRAAHVKKARDLAHSAHHLREQSKSLERSLKTADEAQKKQLDEKLKVVREQMQSIAKERQLHASSALELQGDMQAKSGEEQEYAKDIDGYSQVQQQLTLALCRHGDWLAPIADKETVSIVIARDKTAVKPGLIVDGWVVQKSLLAHCAEGIVDQQYVEQQATRYQY